MLKILNGLKVKDLDSKHIAKSGQSSHELMEVAALGFVHWYISQLKFKNKPVLIVVGSGNNGGDGLAIARILAIHNYEVTVLTCFDNVEKFSHDALINWNLLPKQIIVSSLLDFELPKEGVLIDSFLGVGLRGVVRKSAFPIINSINEFEDIVVSVDLPSGLPSDNVNQGICVKADYTVTFAFPKLSLLMPENAEFVGELVLVSIGIQESTFDEFESEFYFLGRDDIPKLHRQFNRFAYKGDFGKVMIVGGSPGKMGALVLSTKSALRTGSGLVTCHIEYTERNIIQTAVPEAMATWGLMANLEFYDSIGIGPGWGLEGRKHLLAQILEEYQKPVVIDADAINILAKNKEMIDLIPKKSILTPHMGEFNRLVGQTKNHLERLEAAKDFAMKYDLILVLKGANTVISLPNGNQYFNSSGSKYMATGGSGDVLTGMITSYLGQGYTPKNAAICGVYHHGLAGEIAGGKKRKGLIASDLIEAIPETYLLLDIS